MYITKYVPAIQCYYKHTIIGHVYRLPGLVATSVIAGGITTHYSASPLLSDKEMIYVMHT